MTVYKKTYDVKYLLLFIMIGVISGCNMDQHITPAQPDLTEEDELFMTDATRINLKGISLANLAMERSSNGLILAYAQRIMAEHTAAANTLGAMAADFEVDVPENLTAEQQLELDQLSESVGDAFDRIYIQRNIENHTWAQEIMERQINESNIDELVQFAGQQLLEINERLNEGILIQSELP